MIANITLGKKAASMILYNEKKVNKGKAIKLDSSSEIMAIPDAAIDVFDELSSKTKTEDANVQISLSLAIGENVSDETFKKIARDYLKSTGFGDCPFVVYRHHDTQHQHIHICTSIMTHQEKKVDMYYNYIKSQKATRELERKYGLKLVSSVKPKKENPAIKGMKEYRDLLAAIDLDRGKKSDIRKIVAKGTSVILQQYKPTTLPETKKLYASLGIDLTDIANEDGSHRGYVFRLSDRTNTPAIKASDLYMTFTKGLLEKTFGKNQSKKQKCDTKRIARAVQAVQKEFESINTADFEKALREKNILPMFDRYKDGRVYGLSYFDEKTGFIFKASEVGKAFSHGNMAGFLGDDKETKKSQQKLLEDAFYALYNEQKKLGNRTSALNFAKRQDTLGSLVAALRKSGANAENTEKTASEYLSEKIKKLEKAADFVAEKGMVAKALNEHYQKSLGEYLANYPGVAASDYANAQLEAEKGEYVDYVRDSLQLELLSGKSVEAMVDDFIKGKIREEHLRLLNRDINEKTEQRARFVAGQDANAGHPKPNRFYFAYSAVDFAKHLPLFSHDEDRLRAYVMERADRTAVRAMAIERINRFFSEQKELFSGRTAHHPSGNTSLDFHRFLLANKDKLAHELAEKLKAMDGLPKDKAELLGSVAFSENGLVAKYFDRAENRSLPLAKANAIARDAVKKIVSDWRKTLDSRGIAKNLKDPDRIKEIKGLIKEAVMDDPIARKVFLDKPLADKTEAKINGIIEYHQGFYSQKAQDEVSGTAGNVLRTIAGMAQNHPERDGLNTARNDKRNKRRPR